MLFMALTITMLEPCRLKKTREAARALSRSHRKMFGVVFNAKGLYVAEHCRECFHLGQDVSRSGIELLDLAASVDVLRMLEAGLGYGDSRNLTFIL